jgi:hypothetical protein
LEKRVIKDKNSWVRWVCMEQGGVPHPTWWVSFNKRDIWYRARNTQEDHCVTIRQRLGWSIYEPGLMCPPEARKQQRRFMPKISGSRAPLMPCLWYLASGNIRKKKSLWFKALQFVTLCYCSPQKLM